MAVYVQFIVRKALSERVTGPSIWVTESPRVLPREKKERERHREICLALSIMLLGQIVVKDFFWLDRRQSPNFKRHLTYQAVRVSQILSLENSSSLVCYPNNDLDP